MRIKSSSSGIADAESGNAEENSVGGDGTEAVRDVDFESAQTIDKGEPLEISKLDINQTFCEESKDPLIWKVKGSNGTRGCEWFTGGSDTVHHYSDQRSKGRVIVLSGKSFL